MTGSRHRGRSVALLACLLAMACGSEAGDPCGGTGMELLRCRARASGNPEAEKILEVLTRETGPGVGRQTTR
ncbi:MAG TPA: hypothetical protein ENI85_00825 [Deltaproteobacteria bacterium]|nr:hypothetical protein [Deltaproteobacteria bacterium]